MCVFQLRDSLAKCQPALLGRFSATHTCTRWFVVEDITGIADARRVYPNMISPTTRVRQHNIISRTTRVAIGTVAQHASIWRTTRARRHRHRYRCRNTAHGGGGDNVDSGRAVRGICICMVHNTWNACARGASSGASMQQGANACVAMGRHQHTTRWRVTRMEHAGWDDMVWNVTQMRMSSMKLQCAVYRIKSTCV